MVMVVGTCTMCGMLAITIVIETMVIATTVITKTILIMAIAIITIITTPPSPTSYTSEYSISTTAITDCTRPNKYRHTNRRNCNINNNFNVNANIKQTKSKRKNRRGLGWCQIITGKYTNGNSNSNSIITTRMLAMMGRVVVIGMVIVLIMSMST